MCFSIQLRACSLCLSLIACVMRLCASRMRERACGTVDDALERGHEQRVERRLRQGEHLVAARGRHRREEFDDGVHRRRDVARFALELRARAPQCAVRRCAPRGGVLRGGRLDRHHRLPQLDEGHIVERERAAHARAHVARFGPRDAQALLAAPRPIRPCVSSSRMASRTVERLTPN